MDRPETQEVLVSDHAVVRWLERVSGQDIARLRADIFALAVAGGFGTQPAAAGAGVYIDVPTFGVHLVLRDGQVTNVLFSDLADR